MEQCNLNGDFMPIGIGLLINNIFECFCLNHILLHSQSLVWVVSECDSFTIQWVWVWVWAWARDCFVTDWQLNKLKCIKWLWRRFAATINPSSWREEKWAGEAFVCLGYGYGIELKYYIVIQMFMAINVNKNVCLTLALTAMLTLLLLLQPCGTAAAAETRWWMWPAGRKRAKVEKGLRLC